MLKKKAVQVLKANVSLICMNTISGGLGITENTAVMYAQIQLHFCNRRQEQNLDTFWYIW